MRNVCCSISALEGDLAEAHASKPAAVAKGAESEAAQAPTTQARAVPPATAEQVSGKAAAQSTAETDALRQKASGNHTTDPKDRVNDAEQQAIKELT